MKISKRHNGTIIGGIFTLSSFLLILASFISVIPITPTIPLLSVLLGFEIKELIGINATFIFFVVIMLLSLIMIFVRSRRFELTNTHIVIIMAIEFFIIHPLAFFIYWVIDLNFKNDGQVALGLVLTYPISSFGFLALGVLIDLVKIKDNKEKALLTN